MTIITHSAEETLSLGRLIGRLAPAPPATTVIALDGSLGAGKTQLTRGIAEGAGVDDPSLISSPTYVLLNIYSGPKPVYHLDAYRISSPADFEAVGFEEFLSAGGIVVIEWASKVQELLPEDHIHIAINHEGDLESQDRSLSIDGIGQAFASVRQALEHK
jgi:tRNA threonylcarbamoyladenosine biosynthesis protein TsaE